MPLVRNVLRTSSRVLSGADPALFCLHIVTAYAFVVAGSASHAQRTTSKMPICRNMRSMPVPQAAWSEELRCPPGETVCGAQANVVQDPDLPLKQCDSLGMPPHRRMRLTTWESQTSASTAPRNQVCGGRWSFSTWSSQNVQAVSAARGSRNETQLLSRLPVIHRLLTDLLKCAEGHQVGQARTRESVPACCRAWILLFSQVPSLQKGCWQ